MIGRLFKKDKIGFVCKCFFFLYFINAHLILPRYFEGDFFLFSRWDLYSEGPVQYVYDISWDNNETFLLRDHGKILKNLGVDGFLLYWLLQSRKSVASIILKYREDFAGKGASCELFKVVELEGAVYRHIIRKNKLKVLSEKSLCEN